MHVKHYSGEQSLDILSSFKNSSRVPQFSVAWLRSIIGLGKDQFYLVCCYENKEIIGYLPVFRFDCVYGAILQSVPYPAGYCGISIVDKAPRKEVITSIFDYLLSCEEITSNAILYTLVTSPFEENLNQIKESLQPNTELRNFYQYMDLTTLEKVGENSKARNNIKRNLRKAEEAGLTFFTTKDLKSIDDWYNIVKTRIEEIGGSVLPKNIYKAFAKEMLIEEKAVFGMISLDSEIVGAGLYFYNDFCADVFLRANKSSLKSAGAGTFLDYQMIEYFKKMEIRYLNWQSSPSMDSETFKYKKTWGCHLDYHYYLTKKLNGFEGFDININVQDLFSKYKGHFLLPKEEIYARSN